MYKLYIMAILKIRWAYFHINPNYIKFTMGDETHFQHRKTGTLHCNYVWDDEK